MVKQRNEIDEKYQWDLSTIFVEVLDVVSVDAESRQTLLGVCGEHGSKVHTTSLSSQ